MTWRVVTNMSQDEAIMSADMANAFADHWIAAWNRHDLEEILSHYTYDFEMSSPVIVATMNEPSGTLKGKDNVRAYWSKAFERYPDLKFEKLHVLTGSKSVTIIYNGVRGLSAESFHFNRSGKVHAAFAHYL
jgi:ketosteroid isomerase-like protein